MNPNPTQLPEYGTTPTRVGLYLGLFHGRKTPRERMDDWGFNGPMIGPLEYCHTTYGTDLKLEFVTEADAQLFFGDEDPCIAITDGLACFGNCFYGDWTLCYFGPDDVAPEDDTFRHAPRSNAFRAHHDQLIASFVAGNAPHHRAPENS